MNIEIILRNIFKDKLKFLLGTTGLAMGFGGFLILQLFIGIELSYDSFHDEYKKIYRIISETKNNEGNQRIALTDGGLKEYLGESFSSVKTVTHFIPIYYGIKVNTKGEAQEEPNGLYVDNEFNHVFDFSIISGDSSSMFAEINTIALTKSLAIKYFGSVNVVGQTLSLDDGFGLRDVKVTGVYEDVPKNSSIEFDFLMSSKSYRFWDKFKNRANKNYFFTYMKFEDETLDETKTYIESNLNTRNSQLNYVGTERKYALQAIEQIHLDSQIAYDISTKTEAKQIYILGFIALSIILITAINFVNTNTIQSASKIKLLGMIKLFGHKNPFTKILVLDAFIKTILALSIAILSITVLNRSVFEQIFHFKLYLPSYTPIVISIFICVLIGLLGGIIPANYFRRKKISDIVKGKILLSQGKYSKLKLTSLIVQLTIMLVLMTTTSMVIKQLDYFDNKDVGYNKINKVSFSAPTGVDPYSYLKFINGVKELHYIKDIGISWFPFYDKYKPLNINVAYNDGAESKVLYNMVNRDYIPSMGIKMNEGNNFRGVYAYDTLGVIINETAAKLLKDKSSRHSMITADVPLYGSHKFTVIGIMKDFHFESFTNSIEPLFYFCLPFEDFAGDITINFADGGGESLEKDLPVIWKESGIETRLEMETIAEAYAETHKEQNLLASISRSFTMLTLFLALFGLFAYLKHNIEAKTKELAIRRILGATIFHVYYSLNKEILILFLISIAIAVPLGFYISTSWLAQFVYRTQVSAESLILPIVITLLAILGIGLYELFAILSRRATEVLKDE